MWSKPLAQLKDPGHEPYAPSEGSREKGVDFLRKGPRYNRTGNGRSFKAKAREDIKFRPLDDSGDWTEWESEVEDVSKGGARHANLHRWSPAAGSTVSTHSATPTVLEAVHLYVDGGKDLYQAVAPTRLPTGPEVPDPPDYSDHEADITSNLKSARHDPDWTPRFLHNKVHLPKPNSPRTTPSPDQDLSGTQYGLPEPPRNRPQRDNNPRWQAFWRDVDEKTQHNKFMN